MTYLSGKEAALQWKISPRSVRNYCAAGRVPGAVLKGKTWCIPVSSPKPSRQKKSTPPTANGLAARLLAEMNAKLRGGIYHKLQIELTYNSNHMEGSRLTHDQTRFIYETNTLGIGDGIVNVDDVVETANHFRCIDQVIRQMAEPVTQGLIKQLHALLKNGTSDSRLDWFVVGDYKKVPNEVGGRETTPPEQVEQEMELLLTDYENGQEKSFEDTVAFHYRFEAIHPFQDGNGRVGRLLLLKECLRHNHVPFVINEELKPFYYRGLTAWRQEKGYLLDTCLTAQDQFKKWMDYFRIAY